MIKILKLLSSTTKIAALLNFVQILLFTVYCLLFVYFDFLVGR